MNYSELKAAWRQWSHRDDLEDTLLDTIQQLATARLGRDLRTVENEKAEAVTVPAAGYTMGPTFMEMRSVKGYRGIELRYETPAQFLAFNQGNALSWTIENGLLFLNSAGDCNIDYWVTPDQLAADGDTNEVLTQWPNVYIYGGLVEIFRYLQDVDAAGQYMNFYNDEIKQTNKQAQSARIGNAPAMRAV